MINCLTKFKNLWSKLQFHYKVKKANARFWIMEWCKKRSRKKYCRHGCHKIQPDSITFQPHTNEAVTVEYIYCEYCEYKFFATNNDKQLYKQYKEEAKGNFARLLNHSTVKLD